MHLTINKNDFENNSDTFCCLNVAFLLFKYLYEFVYVFLEHNFERMSPNINYIYMAFPLIFQTLRFYLFSNKPEWIVVCIFSVLFAEKYD